MFAAEEAREMRELRFKSNIFRCRLGSRSVPLCVVVGVVGAMSVCVVRDGSAVLSGASWQTEGGLNA